MNNSLLYRSSAFSPQLQNVGLPQRQTPQFPLPHESGRIQSPASSTAAPRISKEVAQKITNEFQQSEAIQTASLVAERDLSSLPPVPNNVVLQRPTPCRPIPGPVRLTVQSTPVKSHSTMISSMLSFNQQSKSHDQTSQNSRTHNHDFKPLQGVQEGHSSSDENRSSGHASMSDTGGVGSSSPTGVKLGPLPEDRLAADVSSKSTKSKSNTNHSRSRHRALPGKVPWSGTGLEDIKHAIKQMTIRSQTSTSTYSSLSAGSESSEPMRRMGRYSSMETVNTNVTTADEFIWVDSQNRLVEVQHTPWTQNCILKVIRNGRCREYSERVAIDTTPRLGYLLQRVLVRISREIQRLSSGFGLCSKHEVVTAFKIILCPALADSCIKACLRAAAMFAAPGDSALKQSKSSRAGLHFPVGKFHRWMADSRLGRFIHEYAAVYLCAGIENMLEEILLQCFSTITDNTTTLTTTLLEHSIGSSADLWGLLQSFNHLNAGRIASGALTMPRWASQSSIGSGSLNHTHEKQSNIHMEPCLLTTCVGNMPELKDLVNRAQQKFQHIRLSNAAIVCLFYFMRCSQLEHNDGNGNARNASGNNVQELCNERAYVVLPPLIEWLRVASAHAEYRSGVLVDKDDIMQAARLLLPGVDCPIRPVCLEEELPSKKIYVSHSSTSMNVSSSEETKEFGRRATIALAFKMMLTGRAELLAQASTILPPTTRYDTLNHNGMTALMIACIRNDEIAIQSLLDAGCDPNIEIPSVGTPGCPAIHPETQYWSALTFAACKGNYQACRMLMERGGKVEGGSRLSEEKLTLTPLQVASGSTSCEIVGLLLAHGANPFLSTTQKDIMCFSGSAQRGCYCAISVASSHGQRASLRKLLSHPLKSGTKDVLSLEEMLAESDPSVRPLGAIPERQPEIPSTLSKTQVKSLQEAMYHSAENNHLGETFWIIMDQILCFI